MKLVFWNVWRGYDMVALLLVFIRYEPAWYQVKEWQNHSFFQTKYVSQALYRTLQIKPQKWTLKTC